mmetsp:Transcript_89837/g.258958  ORF Transcript_89837/g.258958 Transcript_89837/m.258958 type:complete len:541 (-) Transcript_89837:218-1840(-)
MTSRSAGSDDAGGHELGDGLLQLDVRRHRLLGLCRVLLHLPEEHADLRVMQNVLDLGIRHGMLDLLLVDLLAAARLGDLGKDLLLALLALLALRVQGQAFVVRLQGLVVLLHEKVGRAFPGVRLHERGVQLEALVQVLQRVGVREELGESRGAVRVELGVLGVPLYSLVILGLGFNILLLLEELVALFSVLLRLRRVQVGFLLVLLLGALKLPKRVPGETVVVFHQGLVVHLDGLVELFPLLVHRGHSAVHLGHLLERRAARASTVDLIPSVDLVLQASKDLVVMLWAHLDPHRALVVVIRQVVGLLLDGLVIHLQGLLKLLLLVQLVALRLELIGLLLLGGAVIRRRLFLFRLLFSRRRLVLLLGPRPHLLGAHSVDIDALHGHDDLQDAGVLVHHLHEHLLSHRLITSPQLHQHLNLLHEVLVLHVLLDLRILRCGARQGGGVETAEQPAAGTTCTGAGASDSVLGVAGLLQPLLQHGVLRRQLKAGLVGVDGIVVLGQEELGKALPRVTLRPVRLQPHALGAVLQRLIVLLERCIAS